VTPLVSVIIPIFNGEQFLGETLDSVYAQDYAPLEVIVVDDGSVDAGPRIARARGAEVIRHAGKGVAAARNAAVARSTGSVLAFIDQDDLWLPSKIRRQVEALSAWPDSISYTRTRYFLQEGSAVPPWLGRPELLECDSDGFLPSCLAVTRRTFHRVGPFAEDLPRASDLDWNARARQLGIECNVIPELLVLHRVHGGNESGNPRSVTEMFEAVRRSATRRRASGGDVSGGDGNR
jgi:glycosyltransferase involved in cell wall biosynthesis